MRPSTAHRGAGYTPASSRPGTAAASAARPSPFDAPSPAAAAEAAEAHVHRALEASAAAAAAGDRALALERAQEAARGERALVRLLEGAHHPGGPAAAAVDMDLTYAVCVNLGCALAGAGMPAEALHAYSLVVRNAEYPHAWRCRVNAGNLHAQAGGDCGAALKQYRMALDRVPPTQRSLRARIQGNIGVALIRAGRYGDAASALDLALLDAEAAAAGRGGGCGGGGGGGSEDEDDASAGAGAGSARGLGDPPPLPPSTFAIAYNHVACRFALGDAPAMMAAFERLARLPLPLPDADDDEEEEEGGGEAAAAGEEAEEGARGGAGAPTAAAGARAARLGATLSRFDALASELRARTRAAQRLVCKAARLLAPALAATAAAAAAAGGGGGGGGGSGRGGALHAPAPARSGPSAQQPPLAWLAGYDWLVDTLQAARHASVAAELRMVRSLALMERHHLAEAVAELRAFERTGRRHRAPAAVNLSFLYALEGDAANAATYAQLAVAHDRYNARALVNLGNCLAARGEGERARELYLEAIGVEADCAEAIYNLGLVAAAGGDAGDALQAFEKLRSLLLPGGGCPEALLQLARAHDAAGDGAAAGQLVAQLLAAVPCDAGARALQGDLARRAGDEPAAVAAWTAAHRLAPPDRLEEVAAWLGNFYVRAGLFEAAAGLYAHAAALAPPARAPGGAAGGGGACGGATGWLLKQAACLRRAGALPRAFCVYALALRSDPSNAECLTYLAALGRELRHPDAAKYEAQLAAAAAAAQAGGGD